MGDAEQELSGAFDGGDDFPGATQESEMLRQSI